MSNLYVFQTQPGFTLNQPDTKASLSEVPTKGKMIRERKYWPESRSVKTLYLLGI
jgi:hypothetical protein